MSDINILHRIIVAEGEAKRHFGSELGELFHQQILDLLEDLSPRCKMIMLLLPNASYEEVSNYVDLSAE